MVLLRICLSRNYNLFSIKYRQMHLLRQEAFVNGEWVKARSNLFFPVTNPASNCIITEVPDMDESDAQSAIESASEAFKTWKCTTPKERSEILRKWFMLCQKNSEYIAEIMTAESGKPLREAQAEVAYGNSYLEWNADCARHINGEILTSPWKNKKILVSRQPLGVVSVITPWNFPFAMITRKVGAILAAGCTCVVKPSEETPLTALAAADLACQAGVPEGVLNIITTSRKNSPAVGEILCQDNRVQGISFTGSTLVGKILYSHAAKGIKKIFLELGGNAPFIVFPSADVQRAVDHAMLAKFRNNGQACIGANRFFIHEDIYDQFLEAFKAKIKGHCIMGPGSEEGVTCGPLINIDHVNKVESLVDDATSKGAKVLLGGKVNTDLGDNFYESSLLVNVNPEMKIYREEIFGPVAVCMKFKDEDEVLKLANDTQSGLAAYVFTKDLGQAFRMSDQLAFGMVAINDGALSAAEAPFGGVKESGIGREGSMHCVLEFTDTKYTLVSGLEK